MNEYDSLIAASILEQCDGKKALTIENADIILINTCAVREKAQEKVINRATSLLYLRKKKTILIGLIGCVAQSEKEQLLNHVEIDFIIGPDSLRHLCEVPAMLDSKRSSKTVEPIVKATLSKSETYEDISIFASSAMPSIALSPSVTIQRGCNHFCSYCVVPFTRGRERSKSPESIVDEIKKWVDLGRNSVLLLGQNVNSYLYKKVDFMALLEKVLQETNIKKINFTSPHPQDFPIDLLKLIGSESRLVSHLHMPLQSGSDEILKKMKREYTQKEFLNLVEKAYLHIPGLNLTTDVIIGFSGESDKDFDETRFAMQKANFDAAFMFAYSERAHTYAKKKYEDNISEKVKKERLQKIIEEQYLRSEKKNRSWIGKNMKVLPENYARRGKEFIVSRAFNGKSVLLPYSENIQMGKEITIKVESSTSISLFAESSFQ